jgi:hypothetical protein
MEGNMLKKVSTALERRHFLASTVAAAGATEFVKPFHAAIEAPFRGIYPIA